MIKRLFGKYFPGGFFLNAPLLINALIVLVTLPIILANIPLGDYGKWQFVTALQIWLIALTGENITLGAKRGISKGLDGTFVYAFFFRLKLLFIAATIVLAIATYLRTVRPEYHPLSTLLAIMGFYLILGYVFEITLYQFLVAKKRFRQWCYWKLAISLASLVSSTLAAVYTKNIVYFASFQLGAVTILSWIGWFLLVKTEKLYHYYKKGQIDKHCLQFGLKLIPADLLTVTAGKISHFLIGPLSGFGNLAVFAIANKLRDKCAATLKTSRLLLYADFARMDRQHLISILHPNLAKLFAVSVLLTLVLVGAACLYVRFCLPKTFNQVVLYLAILGLGLPAIILAIILRTVLESHFQHKEITAATTITNFLKILLILILGYLFKVIGVCIALALSNWVIFICFYILTVNNTLLTHILQRISHFKLSFPNKTDAEDF